MHWQILADLRCGDLSDILPPFSYILSLERAELPHKSVHFFHIMTNVSISLQKKDCPKDRAIVELRSRLDRRWFLKLGSGLRLQSQFLMKIGIGIAIAIAILAIGALPISGFFRMFKDSLHIASNK